MATREVYQCQCENCQKTEYHPDKQHHHMMNLLLSLLTIARQLASRRFRIGPHTVRREARLFIKNHTAPSRLYNG